MRTDHKNKSKQTCEWQVAWAQARGNLPTKNAIRKYEGIKTKNYFPVTETRMGKEFLGMLEITNLYG